MVVGVRVGVWFGVRIFGVKVRFGFAALLACSLVRTASSRDVCSDEEEWRCVCRVPLGVVRRSP